MEEEVNSWGVWEQMPTGRFFHTFNDEYLAVKFAIRIGSQAIPNPYETF